MIARSSGFKSPLSHQASRALSARTGLSRFGLLLLAVALLAGVGGCAFDDPTVVVGEAVDAAKRGDRDDFIACFTPRSRPILETWWATVDEVRPELGALGAGDVRVVGFRPLGVTDPSVSARGMVTLREGSRSMPLILHRTGGSWRIDLLDTERVTQGVPTGP